MIAIDHLTKLTGTYILALEVRERILIQIKKLQWNLEPGIYLYYGSAKGRKSTSLKNRIQRHFDTEKTIFWHIDYLTTHSSVILHCAYVNFSEQSTECQNLANFSNNVDIDILTRFGNSDCKKGCGGHLGFVSNKNLSLLWLSNYFERYNWKRIDEER